MPPTASRVSDQFAPVDSTGRSSMVICNHCRVQKVPKNSLQRKEEHLRNCSAFSMSPLATETNVNGQTLLEDSIARRVNRTKPGNTRVNSEKEVLRLQRIGAALMAGNGGGSVGNASSGGGMGLQERVERIIRGEASRPGTGSSNGSPETPYSNVTYNNYPSYTSPTFSTENSGGPSASNETMVALLESATRTPTINDGNNPRKRPLTVDNEVPSADIMTSRTPSVTPGTLPVYQHPSSAAHTNNLSMNNSNPSLTPSNDNTSNKRFKNAELYLDEDDFDFVCSAQTAREIRLAALVERLARLVRLRDMR